MSIDLGSLEERAILFQTFSPPPMNRICKSGSYADCEVAELIKCAIEKCAEELEIPVSLRSKLLVYDKVESRKDHYQLKPLLSYLTDQTLSDLQCQIEDTDVDFDLSNKTEVIDKIEQPDQPDNPTLLRPPENIPKVLINIKKKIAEHRQQTSQSRKHSTGSSLISKEIISKLSFDLGRRTRKYTVLPPESKKYTNLPFGLNIENIGQMLRTKCLNIPERLCDIEASMNAQIRFDLPQDLCKLQGLTVLDYLMEYCRVQPKLRKLLKDRYKMIPQWQRTLPLELIKEHVDKALIQLIDEEELERFINYFNFELGFVMNVEAYVRIVALSLRLYGSRLKNFHRSYWSYQVGFLESIDFRTAAKLLMDVALDPRLDELLKKLCQIASEQIYF